MQHPIGDPTLFQYAFYFYSHRGGELLALVILLYAAWLFCVRKRASRADAA